jgi:hypothetical protein
MGPQLLVDCSSLANRIDTPVARGSAPAVRTCALLEKRSAQTGNRPTPPEQSPKESDEQVKALVAATLIFMPLLAGWLVLTAGQ